MTPKIELIQVGEDSLLLDDVRSVKEDGTSKRLGFLPRIDDAILRFVVPVTSAEADFVHKSVTELRKASSMSVSARVLRQLEPAELARALKRGTK